MRFYLLHGGMLFDEFETLDEAKQAADRIIAEWHLKHSQIKIGDRQIGSCINDNNIVVIYHRGKEYPVLEEAVK